MAVLRRSPSRKRTSRRRVSSPSSPPVSRSAVVTGGAEAQAAAILAVVRDIPRGRVTTYGAVAQRAGLPRRARLVGKVLAGLANGAAVPWHRVVAAGGRIAFPQGTPSREEQIRRLRVEGIEAARGRVDMRRHGWGDPGGDFDRWLWGRGE